MKISKIIFILNRLKKDWNIEYAPIIRFFYCNFYCTHSSHQEKQIRCRFCVIYLVTGAEFGFDKAIVSHYKHTDLYKSNYTEVKDGWYEPSVGGNYYYNLKGGYSFGKNDITIVAGKIISQDFMTKPLFPIFTQIGYNIKF